MSELPDRRVVVEAFVPRLKLLLSRRSHQKARRLLHELLDPEIADVLRELGPEERVSALRLLPAGRAADILTFLATDLQIELLQGLGQDQAGRILEAMSLDDRVALLEETPAEVATHLLYLMRPEERRRTLANLNYPEESVGRLMTPDYLTLRPQWTVRQALAYIRKHGHDAETIHTLYVVDEQGKLLDDVRLRHLILSSPDQSVESLLDGICVSLQVTEDQEQAVRTMDRYDRPVIPVVDSENRLAGVVTFDDVIDVASEETTEDIHKMGGTEALDQPYISVPFFELVRKRGLWLSVLFLGQLLTASTMGFFQEEMAQALVLTLFIPLVISSGGNSGSQASTLIIRALALREIHLRDWWRVFRREMGCGLVLGFWLGLLGLLRIQVWQGMGWEDYSIYYLSLGIAVSMALIGVVLWGTLAGSMLPFLLRRIGLDPATVSAPFVATLVDVTGLIIYFSSALLLLRGRLL